MHSTSGGSLSEGGPGVGQLPFGAQQHAFFPFVIQEPLPPTVLEQPRRPGPSGRSVASEWSEDGAPPLTAETSATEIYDRAEMEWAKYRGKADDRRTPNANTIFTRYTTPPTTSQHVRRMLGDEDTDDDASSTGGMDKNEKKGDGHASLMRKLKALDKSGLPATVIEPRRPDGAARSGALEPISFAGHSKRMAILRSADVPTLANDLRRRMQGLLNEQEAARERQRRQDAERRAERAAAMGEGGLGATTPWEEGSNISDFDHAPMEMLTQEHEVYQSTYKILIHQVGQSLEERGTIMARLSAILEDKTSHVIKTASKRVREIHKMSSEAAKFKGDLRKQLNNELQEEEDRLDAMDVELEEAISNNEGYEDIIKSLDEELQELYEKLPDLRGLKTTAADAIQSKEVELLKLKTGYAHTMKSTGELTADFGDMHEEWLALMRKMKEFWVERDRVRREGDKMQATLDAHTPRPQFSAAATATIHDTLVREAAEALVPIQQVGESGGDGAVRDGGERRKPQVTSEQLMAVGHVPAVKQTTQRVEVLIRRLHQLEDEALNIQSMLPPPDQWSNYEWPKDTPPPEMIRSLDHGLNTIGQDGPGAGRGGVKDKGIQGIDDATMQDPLYEWWDHVKKVWDGIDCYYVGLGTEKRVPRWLRVVGRVRDKQISKREARKVVVSIMQNKQRHQIKLKTHVSLVDYVGVYLKDRYGIDGAIIEVGYNVVGGVMHWSNTDNVIAMFLNVLTRNLTDGVFEVYHAIITGCQEMLEELYKDNIGLNPECPRGQVQDAVRSFLMGRNLSLPSIHHVVSQLDAEVIQNFAGEEVINVKGLFGMDSWTYDLESTVSGWLLDEHKGDLRISAGPEVQATARAKQTYRSEVQSGGEKAARARTSAGFMASSPAKLSEAEEGGGGEGPSLSRSGNSINVRGGFLDRHIERATSIKLPRDSSSSNLGGSQPARRGRRPSNSLLETDPGPSRPTGSSVSSVSDLIQRAQGGATDSEPMSRGVSPERGGGRGQGGGSLGAGSGPSSPTKGAPAPLLPAGSLGLPDANWSPGAGLSPGPAGWESAGKGGENEAEDFSHLQRAATPDEDATRGAKGREGEGGEDAEAKMKMAHVNPLFRARQSPPE